MKKSAVIKKIAQLKNIPLNEEAILVGRARIMDFIATHPCQFHQDIEKNWQAEVALDKKAVWGWSLVWKMGAVCGAVVLFVALGWQSLLLTANAPEAIQAELTAIKNEWQLTDASPYLEKIFDDKSSIAFDNGSNPSLALETPSHQVDSLKKASRKEMVISEAINLNNFGGSLPTTEGDVNKALDRLIF